MQNKRILALTIILTIIIYICTITGAWYLADEIYRIIGGPDLNSQYTIDFFKIIMYIIFATILLITAHLSFVFILAGIVEFLCEGLK